MTLSVAVILSGLPQEEFTGDLEPVFNQGSVLLKTPPSGSPPKSSRSSSTDSGFQSVHKIDTEEYFNILDTMQPDIKVENVQPDIKVEKVQHDIKVEKVQVDPKVEKEQPDKQDKKESKTPKTNQYWKYSRYSSENIQINYENRNLLDLKFNWPFQYASLQNGVTNFFDNRSQLSRLDGAEIPPHVIRVCKCKGCCYKEPVYQ